MVIIINALNCRKLIWFLGGGTEDWFLNERKKEDDLKQVILLDEEVTGLWMQASTEWLGGKWMI